MWLWRGRDQILRKILLNDTSRALSCGDEDLQREAPHRERQKLENSLENSLVFTKGSQQEKVCNKQLDLRRMSLEMAQMSSSSDKLYVRMCQDD